MSRLTDKDSYCFVTCADDYKGTDSLGENCKLYKACFERKMYDKLKHYEDLEEAGRLIELPCKVGDTVYSIVFENCNDGTCRWLENGVCIKGGITSEYCPQTVISREFELSDLERGRRFYLTSAEAEAKLAELKEGAE